MTDGKVAVRELATGQTSRVWPVDAAELLASQEYEPADEAAARVAAHQPIMPLRRPHPTDAVSVRAAHAAEVARLSAATKVIAPAEAGAVAVLDEPTPAASPKKRGRGKG